MDVPPPSYSSLDLPLRHNSLENKDTADMTDEVQPTMTSVPSAINDNSRIESNEWSGRSQIMRSGDFTGIHDLSFLEDVEVGCAGLIISKEDGSTETIEGLDHRKIAERCPQLASAFTALPSTPSVLYFDVEQTLECDLTNAPQSAVIGLLRWIYVEDYAFCEAMIDAQIPLLLHLQILRLAQRFDADNLADLVIMHIEAETRMAIETRSAILDLCEATRFLYTELRESEGLRVMIANYIISNLEVHLNYHGEALKQTAYQSPLFHHDLTRANCESDFSSSMADVVIKMPTCSHDIHKGLVSTGIVNDFTCEFHTEVMPRQPGSTMYTGQRRKLSFLNPDEEPSPPTSPKRARQTLRLDVTFKDHDTSNSANLSLRQKQPVPSDKHDLHETLPYNEITRMARAPPNTPNLPPITTRTDRSLFTTYTRSIDLPSVAKSEPPKSVPSLISDMRLNARMSTASSAKQELQDIRPTDSTKQQAAAKSALTALLKGSSPYARVDDEQTKPPAYTKKEDSGFELIIPRTPNKTTMTAQASSSPTNGDRFEIIDLSEDEEWETIQKSEV